MANSWGTNPIVLDTQNDDSSYLAANDGTKFSTQKYKVKKVQVIGGANGNDVEINQVAVGALGKPIIDMVLETGDLNPVINFPGGIWFKGICPKTLDGSCQVLIHLA